MTSYKPAFDSPLEQNLERNGHGISPSSASITDADAERDVKVLPMDRIRFADGTEIEAWPEEVEAS